MLIPTREEMREALEKRQGKDLQDRLAHAAVAVCGLGGLGSNIAVALARAGVGKLILADFDRIEISNLHRQQFKVSQIGMYKTEALALNLKEIAPYTELELHTVRVTEDNAEELLRGSYIVCEAFDAPQAKAMLANAVLERMPEKFLVAASGMAGLGSANNIKTERIAPQFYLCGDRVSDIANGSGLVSSRVMLCAAHQAHTVLRILANEFDV